MIDWADYPKCSFGTLNGEWYLVILGTASSYMAQIEGDRSPVWHAMSSTRSVSMIDYSTRDVAKLACQETVVEIPA